MAAGLTTQLLESRTEQGCPLVPTGSLPYRSDYMVRFVNTLSSLSLPPTSAAQVLVASFPCQQRPTPPAQPQDTPSRSRGFGTSASTPSGA